MPRNTPLGILHIDPSFGTKNRDQGSIQKGRPYLGIFGAKEVIDFFTIFAIKNPALVRWTFAFPGIDGLSHVTRYPNPERAAILAGRNMQIENVGTVFVLHSDWVL